MDQNEFEKIISVLRSENPSEFQIAKWKRAIRVEKKQLRKIQFWGPLFAASLGGFVVGALIFGDFSIKKSQENATIEYVHYKNY